MEAQNAQILHHLKKGLEISPLAALHKYQCMRLAARIYDLKKLGWPIVCDKRDVGDNKKVAFYMLLPEGWPE